MIIFLSQTLCIVMVLCHSWRGGGKTEDDRDKYLPGKVAIRTVHRLLILPEVPLSSRLYVGIDHSGFESACNLKCLYYWGLRDYSVWGHRQHLVSATRSLLGGRLIWTTEFCDSSSNFLTHCILLLNKLFFKHLLNATYWSRCWG